MGNGGETNEITIFSIGAGRRSRSKGDSSAALPIERGSLLRVVVERIKRLSLSLQAALGDHWWLVAGISKKNWQPSDKGGYSALRGTWDAVKCRFQIYCASLLLTYNE